MKHLAAQFPAVKSKKALNKKTSAKARRQERKARAKKLQEMIEKECALKAKSSYKEVIEHLRPGSKVWVNVVPGHYAANQ